jgi:hypothetical protein
MLLPKNDVKGYTKIVYFTSLLEVWRRQSLDNFEPYEQPALFKSKS